MKRTLADFGGRAGLRPAERKLADEVQTGFTVEISDRVPPENAPPEHRIRASFIRYLALGGCDACRPSPKGVRAQGAYIEGDEDDPRAETPGLDLEGCTLDGDLALVACRLPDRVLLRSASLRNLYLNQSHLMGGLDADRLDAKGNVVLREAMTTGEVRLLGARLGGDLSCVGAALRAGRSGKALSADRLDAKGAVYLNKAIISGAVRLLGAKLGGDLDLEKSTLRAIKDGDALNADGLYATGSFFLRGDASINGVVDLTGAEVGAISDDSVCWPMRKGDLFLDRFRYGAILGGPVNARERLRWLALQDPSRFGEDFWPQPYEQLARVFRETGHADDARTVQIEKERLQRADRRRRVRREANYAEIRLDWLWDRIVGAAVGYGYRPVRAIWALALVWLVGTMVFAAAADRDALKPNSAVILRSAEWAACSPDYAAGAGMPPGRWQAGHTSQLACFHDQPEAAAYPRFNPFVYSADTLLPIVDLELQAYWIPDERSAFGRWARVWLWAQIAIGWGLSLLAVAGFSGLIKSD